VTTARVATAPAGRPAAVALTTVERRLALFANGITGEHHEIRTYGDEEAGADAIQLPESFAAFDDVTANLGAYRCMTLHQLGYREFGTYRFRIAEARARCRELAVRDPGEPSPRLSDYDQFYAHFGVPEAAARIFEIVEGHRIDCAMLARYPGIAAHYRRLCAWELDRRLASPEDPFAQLVDGLVRWTLGESPDSRLIDDLATIASAVRGTGADVYTSAAVTTLIIECLERHGFLSTEVIRVLDGLDAPLTERPAFQGPPPNEWLQREDRLADWRDMVTDLDELIEGDDEQDGVIVDRALIDRRDLLARRADMERSALAAVIDPEDIRGRRSVWYPEWDMHANAYRPRWCRVLEERLAPMPDSTNDAEALLHRIAAQRKAVRDCFLKLPLEALERVRHVNDGEDLNWDDLIRYAVDRHRGDVPDERVYERRDRAARDIATVFLVDLSASTDDAIVTPDPEPEPQVLPPATGTYPHLRDPYDDDGYVWAAKPAAELEPVRRIIDVLRESLWLMAAGLNDLHDAFAIYGFSGYGRHEVEFAIAKDFREPWDGRAARALLGMKPRRSTRMGPAIRHARRKLDSTHAALKILVLLSDGFPQDCDYGPDRGKHDYGVADTGKALNEAHSAGIQTFCVTVDRSGHDYLKAMCPDDRYLVIEDIEGLPAALADVYQMLSLR